LLKARINIEFKFGDKETYFHNNGTVISLGQFVNFCGGVIEERKLKKRCRNHTPEKHPIWASSEYCTKCHRTRWWGWRSGNEWSPFKYTW
jgi:hypothetical protein